MKQRVEMLNCPIIIQVNFIYNITTQRRQNTSQWQLYELFRNKYRNKRLLIGCSLKNLSAHKSALILLVIFVAQVER